MTDTHPVTPDLATLASLFYSSPEALGEFEEVTADEMPKACQTLLAHNNHMTVTVEAYHDSPVDVQVLDKNVQQNQYARKILLSRQSDGRVVQYGIVRLDLSYLAAEVAEQIRSESIPLGRVLISNNVLREVELVSLWHVKPADELRELLAMHPGQETYGRTALIHVDGEPAVELLEIVTPVD